MDSAGLTAVRRTLARVDRYLNRTVGIPWLRATRERAIHERCRYALALLEELDLDEPVILDVGCGSGMLFRYLAAWKGDVAQYAGIDLRAEHLNDRYFGMLPPHSFHDIDLDSAWTMPDCDFAWSSEVLEHLIDDSGVLGRIVLCLRPGGYMAVTSPSLAFLRRMARNHPEALNVSKTQDGGHVRSGYTPNSLRALAEGAGLEIVRIDAVSPRTEFEFASRFGGIPVAREIIDRIPLAGRPAFVRNADDETLSRYFSIAAVLRKPAS